MQNARLPCVAFSTMHIGIDGLTTPAIGPTAPRSWHGPNSSSPAAAIRSASSWSRGQPLVAPAAPTIAPRSGPDMSAQSIGGPACSSVRSVIPGSRSRATPTPTSIGCAASSRATASSLARAIAARLGGQPAQRVVALGGRAPVDALDLDALALELAGEQLEADVRDRVSAAAASSRA